MVRHIVLVRFAPGIDDAERAGVLAELAALQAAVPGMLSFAAGPNVSAEDRSAGFMHAFTMDFADEPSRDAYLAAPAHVAAASRLLRATGGDAGIIVADLNIKP